MYSFGYEFRVTAKHRFCLIRAASVPPLKILNVSERTGMSVVSHNGDVFAPQKLASRSVHGCTLLDSLFQKAYGRGVYRVRLLKMLNVSERTGMSVVPCSSDVFAQQKLAFKN